MTVSAPPRPPSPGRAAPDSKALDRDEIEALVEALIEEARRETRRRHRRYWALAALAALVGAVILILLDGGAASQTAAPAVSAQSNAATRSGPSRIAFLRLRGSLATCRPVDSCDNGMYVMNADGSGLRRLTRNAALGPGPSADPAWSPDGRKLVFVKRPERSGAACRPTGRCHEEIYVINADGSGLRRLTRNAVFDGNPVWSPDGRSIAFTRDRDRQTVSIYVMNADGSGQRMLTPNVRRRPWVELAWSPDWEKIAFVASGGHLGAADIFVINADGSGLRNVTNTVTTSFDFAWSPDGRRIAYLEASPGKGGGPLSVVNADGTGKHPLKGTLMVDLGLPSWSPDGRTIAFTGGSVIYTVHANGTGLRELTHGPGHNLDPQWSPDGRRILFLSVRNDLAHYGFDLFVMNADGSGQRNLTHTPGVSEIAPSWSP
jgi:Tol biopolymer transport system component